MQPSSIFFLVSLAIMSCSAVPTGDPKEPHSLVKRRINCPPKAICLPATQPPPIISKRSTDLEVDEVAVEGESLTDPNIEAMSSHRQKRGSKPVPIIACNRKTGKCTRI